MPLSRPHTQAQYWSFVPDFCWEPGKKSSHSKKKHVKSSTRNSHLCILIYQTTCFTENVSYTSIYTEPSKKSLVSAKVISLSCEMCKTSVKKLEGTFMPICQIYVGNHVMGTETPLLSYSKAEGMGLYTGLKGNKRITSRHLCNESETTCDISLSNWSHVPNYAWSYFSIL